MKLYFNGCSHTFGDELINPQQDSWPVLVSSYLNAEFLNDAVSGGTNDRIVYKTVQNVSKYDYFFIAWTHYGRFTEYNPVDNFEINFNPSLNLDVSLHHSDDLKKNRQKYIKYGTMYYKHWFNHLYQFKLWLQQIILLQSFLKNCNKRYLMINTAGNNYLPVWLQPEDHFIESTKHLIDFFDYVSDNQLINEHHQIQSLVSMVDTSTFVEWPTWDLSKISSTCPRGPGGHLLENGHKEIAKKIIEHYNKNL